jgi:hypothetical protein
MHRRIHASRALGFVILACLAGAALATPALAQGKKHHIQIGLGYHKHLSDDLKDPLLGDYTDAGLGVLAYRFSLSPMVDLTFDSRATIHSEDFEGVDVSLHNYFVGPGVRVGAPTGSVRPYGQANFLFVTEKLEIQEDNTTLSVTENGAGFGLFGGVDVRASNLLSVPIEVHYLFGEPEDDVSGVGISAGLTFNFGSLD